MKYIEQFLNMKCAGDVIGIVGKQKNYQKEITEAMSLRKHVKDVVLKEENKDKFVVIDTCSGNALVPILCAFSLPIQKAYATDIRERDRPWSKVNKFEYKTLDIFDKEIENLIKQYSDVILTSSHPCGKLAKRTVELYSNFEQVKYMFVMPCCVNKIPQDMFKVPQLILDKLTGYEKWCLYLQGLVGYSELTRDPHVMSQKNCIISAKSV